MVQGNNSFGLNESTFFNFSPTPPEFRNYPFNFSPTPPEFPKPHAPPISCTHLLIFLTAVLSAWKSGRSAASSVQQRFIRFMTSSSHVSSSTEGRKLTFCPFFTFSTISARGKPIIKHVPRGWPNSAACFRKPSLVTHFCRAVSEIPDSDASFYRNGPKYSLENRPSSRSLPLFVELSINVFKNPTLVPILSQLNPVYTLTPCFRLSSSCLPYETQAYQTTELFVSMFAHPFPFQHLNGLSELQEIRYKDMLLEATTKFLTSTTRNNFMEDTRT